jgi:hypothetical protein
MATDRIRALQVDDTEVVTQVIGSKALRSACADDSTIEVNSGTGQLRVKPQGTALGNGIQRASMSKFAGTTLQGSLTASDAAAGVFSLENTYGTDLIVRRVTLDVTTAATSTPNCELDIGTAATAILSDNLIDGVNVNSTGLFDNYGDSGTNGKFKQKWVSGEFLTASMSAGATAALVGTYLVEVIDMN